MVHFREKDRYDYGDLLEIIRILRSPEGCPWDQVQTHASIRRGLLEEAYEAAEAIDRDDAPLLQEELGDVLMQVVFHADIERQRGRFTMEDVVDGEVRKLLFRHPHVFGSAAPEKDAESVLVSWDAIKRREKHQRTTAQAMDSVARSLPALWRAEKLQNKAAADGFDWPDIQGALTKLEMCIRDRGGAVSADGAVPGGVPGAGAAAKPPPGRQHPAASYGSGEKGGPEPVGISAAPAPGAGRRERRGTLMTVEERYQHLEDVYKRQEFHR